MTAEEVEYSDTPLMYSMNHQPQPNDYYYQIPSPRQVIRMITSFQLDGIT
jgi:hypothetical protein